MQKALRNSLGADDAELRADGQRAVHAALDARAGARREMGLTGIGAISTLP